MNCISLWLKYNAPYFILNQKLKGKKRIERKLTTVQTIILVASNLLFYVILAFPSTYLFGLGLALRKEAKEKKY